MKRRGRIMRRLCVVVPTIAALASPALAQSARKGKAQRAAHTSSAPVGQPRFGTDPDQRALRDNAAIQLAQRRQQETTRGLIYSTDYNGGLYIIEFKG
jgi:hypothetical protein